MTEAERGGAASAPSCCSARSPAPSARSPATSPGPRARAGRAGLPLAVSADAAQMPVAGALRWSSWPAGAWSWSPGAACAGWLMVLGALAAPRPVAGQRRRPASTSVPDRAARRLHRDRDRRPGRSSLTGWFWAAAVAGGASIPRRDRARGSPGPGAGPRWAAGTTPPATQEPAPVVEPEDQSSLDLWRAMDEGRDPTGLTARSNTTGPRPRRARPSTPRHEEPRMSDNHGNTPAAWSDRHDNVT